MFIKDQNVDTVSNQDSIFKLYDAARAKYPKKADFFGKAVECFNSAAKGISEVEEKTKIKPDLNLLAIEGTDSSQPGIDIKGK